jgi:tripartite motif-containing protein 71
VCTAGACAAGTWTNLTSFGTYGTTGDNTLNEPREIWVSSDGLTAWIADVGNNRIAIWNRPNATSTTWSPVTTFGARRSGDSEFSGPSSVWVSSDGLTAWIADTFNDRIVIWNRPNATSTAWSYLTQFGSEGTGDSQLNNPYSVWVASDGLTAWVADYGNDRIVTWNRPDAASTTWSFAAKFGTNGTLDNELDHPNGIRVSSDQRTMWIVDYSNSRIVIRNRADTSSTSWSYVTQFGSEGTGDSEFDYPEGMGLSGDELTVWVADNNNHRVVKWSRPDAASTAWAYVSQFGSNGTGADNFKDPSGVWVTSDPETALVVDTSNNRISIWGYA